MTETELLELQTRPTPKTPLRVRLAAWLHPEIVAENKKLTEQCAALLQSTQDLLSASQSQGQRATFGDEYLRLCADLRGFRAFLAEFFSSYLDRAVALNTPILEVAKQIMLEERFVPLRSPAPLPPAQNVGTVEPVGGPRRDAITANTCTVCGFEMRDGPRDWNICPCCGIEFNFHDADISHEELRAHWIRTGMNWWSVVEKPQTGWNPVLQLGRLRTANETDGAPNLPPDGQ